MSTEDHAVKQNSLNIVRSGYSRTPRGKVRYKDPSNPARTWSGYGKAPAWIRAYLDAGKELQDFEVKD